MWSRVFTALLFFPAALYPQNTDPLTFQAVSAHLDSFKITDFRVFVYKNGVPVYQNPQEERKTEKQKICLGELSAVFTHLAVMKLAETGKIRLEDDAFKLAGLSHYSRTENPVTVLQLLTHSHNLRHSVFRLMTLSAAGKKIRATESIRTRRISFTNTAGPLNKVPYSASLLALIIEKNTGRSFEDFMRSEIFIPLGMNEATYTAPDSAPRSLYPADSGLWVSGSDIEKFLAFLSSPDPEYADLFKNKKEYLRTDIYSPSPHLPNPDYA